MNNYKLKTENNKYVLLETGENQEVNKVGSHYFIKTKGKLEEISLKTHFKNFKYSLINEYEFLEKKLKHKTLNLMSDNNNELKTNKKYFLFARINK